MVDSVEKGEQSLSAKQARSEIPVQTLARVQTNQLIMETIFSFLPVEDLKQIRHVSRHWNELVNPVFFRKAWVRTATMFDRVPDDKDKEPRGFSALMTIMREDHPTFQPINFKLTDMNLRDTRTKESKAVEFFERFGKFIRRLSLKLCVIDKTGELWTNLVRISKWTDRLEELTLDHNSYIVGNNPEDDWGLPSRHKIKCLRLCLDNVDGYDDEGTSTPCNMTDIWREFPFLEVLQLEDLSEQCNLELLGSMKPTSKKPCEPICKHLKKLEIFRRRTFTVEENPAYQLKLLTELNVPLTKLTVDIGVLIKPSQFKQLLVTYAATLKDLVIWRGPRAHKLKLPGFPFGVTLPVLEYAEIPENCLLNFNFIPHVPKLQTMIVRQCDHHLALSFLINPMVYQTDLFDFRYSYMEWKYFTQNPHKVLTELNIEFEIKDEHIEFLRLIFPNLKTLSAVRNKSLTRISS